MQDKKTNKVEDDRVSDDENVSVDTTEDVSRSPEAGKSDDDQADDRSEDPATADDEDQDGQDDSAGVPDGTTADEDQDDDHAPKSVREARKYRQRAQQAEAERDTIQQQLTSLRTQLVCENAEKTYKINTELFQASGIDPNTLFTDDGALDYDKLKTECEGIRERFGLGPAPRRTVRDNPLQGNPGRPVGGETWSEAITGQPDTGMSDDLYERLRKL